MRSALHRVPPPENPPRLGEALQTVAQRRGEPAVSGMAIGNERVIAVSRLWLGRCTGKPAHAVASRMFR